MVKAVLSLTLAGALMGADKHPSQSSMESALEQARQAWNYDSPFPIVIREEPLNSCSGRSPHDVANTQVTDTWSTLTMEGEEPVTTHAYTIVILINSSCDWSKLNLVAVMTHEYGHVLLGAAYHSRDKRSIMYPIVGGLQQIMPADMDLVKAKYEVRK